MTRESAISIRGVSKKYHLFQNPAHRVLEALSPFKKKYHTDFWALQDIDLEIPKGSTIGILGRNGSGKSTLLQIICGVLQPTRGNVCVDGRISALLELGAGFHPEFTGRENVILNGSFMGFTKKQMLERLPAIEEFAGIGEFIDQPVKTYSSGMFVRLAFSAATAVDPDILVIDEALAVGDARFQHKCYTLMRKFHEMQKTIVLVSHDVSSILQICDHCVLLEGGELVKRGKPIDVCRYYHNVVSQRAVFGNVKLREDAGEEQFESGQQLVSLGRKEDTQMVYGGGELYLVSYGVLDENNHHSLQLVPHSEYSFIFVVQGQRDIELCRFGMHLTDRKGVVLYGINSIDAGVGCVDVKVGERAKVSFSCKIPLAPGDYFITFGATSVDGAEVFCRYVDFLHVKIEHGDNRFKRESLIDLQAKLSVEKEKVNV